jgi:hypothetical protein
MCIVYSDVPDGVFNCQGFSLGRSSFVMLDQKY